MRQQRRQNLRTNELSEQLEQMSAYAKRNVVALTATVIVAAGIVGGGWWYIHHRKTRLMEGWATLSLAADRAEPGSSPISAYESVAQADMSPGLTAEALLMVGSAALEKLEKLNDPNAAPTDAAAADQTDWAAEAERAYAGVIARFPDNTTAVGSAMILTGVVSEDRQDFAKAREWYQKVFDEPRFAHTPFRQQAGYRLEHLDHWKVAVAFAAPLQTVPEPPPAPPTAEAPPRPMALQPTAAQPGAAPITLTPVPTPPAAVPPAPVPAAPNPGDAPSAAPTGDNPAQPTGAAPAAPAGNPPAQPADDAPAQPTGAAPAQPAGDAPAPPTSPPAGG
jgi:hypothetical protein